MKNYGRTSHKLQQKLFQLLILINMSRITYQKSLWIQVVEFIENGDGFFYPCRPCFCYDACEIRSCNSRGGVGRGRESTVPESNTYFDFSEYSIWHMDAYSAKCGHCRTFLFKMAAAAILFFFFKLWITLKVFIRFSCNVIYFHWLIEANTFAYQIWVTTCVLFSRLVQLNHFACNQVLNTFDVFIRFLCNFISFHQLIARNNLISLLNIRIIIFNDGKTSAILVLVSILKTLQVCNWFSQTFD